MAAQMPYWQRLVIGLLMGLFALLGMWYFVGITWLTALVAALTAPLIFLGSFFVFSADRLDEGYEQVLFDKPNTILSVIMIVVFAGAGVGTGFIDLGGAGGPRAVGDIAAEYQQSYDAYQKGSLPAEQFAAKVDALKAELGDPAGDPAADWLAKTLDAAKSCAGSARTDCPDAFNAFIEYRLASSA